MRMRILVLSAVLGLLSTTPLLAQSVNQVIAQGYIQVTFQPGFNLITCPLICSPDNTLEGVLPNDSPDFPYANFEAYQYPYNGLPVYGVANGLGSYAGGGWDNSSLTLNPGQAAFIYNGNATAITTKIYGTVPQGTLVTILVPGYNMTGSQVPYTGDLTLNVGVPPNDYPDLQGGQDDFILFYNNEPGFPIGFSNAYLSGGPYSPGWNPHPMTTSDTEGFYYYNAQAQVSTAVNETWTEKFTP